MRPENRRYCPYCQRRFPRMAGTYRTMVAHICENGKPYFRLPWEPGAEELYTVMPQKVWDDDELWSGEFLDWRCLDCQNSSPGGDPPWRCSHPHPEIRSLCDKPGCTRECLSSDGLCTFGRMD